MVTIPDKTIRVIATDYVEKEVYVEYMNGLKQYISFEELEQYKQVGYRIVNKMSS